VETRGYHGPKSAFADSLDGIGASPGSHAARGRDRTIRPERADLREQSAKADFGPLLQRIHSPRSPEMENGAGEGRIMSISTLEPVSPALDLERIRADFPILHQ